MRALLALAVAGRRRASRRRGAGRAASFPNRPVRIVVPFPAGGPTDVNMRIVGQKLSELWGQGVVIENRPGANTGIGAQMVAKSPADGYTLLAAMDTTLVMNPATGAAMNYDPFKDFAADHADGEEHLAADGARERRAEDDPGADRARQGEQQEAQLRRRHHHHPARRRDRSPRPPASRCVLVPYKGSSEVVQGLLTGSVDFIVDGIAPSLPLIQSGQFRAARQAQQPARCRRCPTSSRCRRPGPADRRRCRAGSAWSRRPARRPRSSRKSTTMWCGSTPMPAVADRLEKAGIIAVTTTPAEFDKFFRAEAERWTKVYKESGIKLD